MEDVILQKILRVSNLEDIGNSRESGTVKLQLCYKMNVNGVAQLHDSMIQILTANEKQWIAQSRQTCSPRRVDGFRSEYHDQCIRPNVTNG